MEYAVFSLHEIIGQSLAAKLVETLGYNFTQ